MRLLSYSIDGDHGFGLLTADRAGVIDLGCRLDAEDLGALLAGEGLDAARPFLDEPADHAVADIVFERLLPSPGKIFCIGVNYGGRAQEYDDPADAAYPSVFVRFPPSFTGHEQPVIRPPRASNSTTRARFVVIGRHPDGKAGRIPVADARSHIAGLTLGNEGTIRDWVRHAKFNVTQGKLAEHRLDGAMAGADRRDPAVRRAADPDPRQRRTPSRRGSRTMKYSIEYQIHYLSTFCELQPGDVIYTGTPTGAGARFDPPVWLRTRRCRRGLGARDRHAAKSGRCRDSTARPTSSHRRSSEHRATPDAPVLRVAAHGLAARPRGDHAEVSAVTRRTRPHRATVAGAPSARLRRSADRGLRPGRTHGAARTLGHPHRRPSRRRRHDSPRRRRGRRTPIDACPHHERRRLVTRIAPQSEATYAEIEAAFGADRLAALLDELDDLTVVLDAVDDAREAS